MQKEIWLSKGAVKAAIMSSLTGPCCLVKNVEKLRQVLEKGNEQKLSDLTHFLSEGVISALIVYSVTRKTNMLTEADVAWLYCIEHMNIVRADEQTFLAGQAGKDPGLTVFHERGFTLNQDNLAAYLYSCLGKIGIVAKKCGKTAEIKTSECLLENVWVGDLNIKVGQKAFVHFATAVAKISPQQAAKICAEQERSAWFLELRNRLAGRAIDYQRFCRNDLTRYTQSELHP